MANPFTVNGLRSSVRPIVTYLFALTLCLGFGMEKVPENVFSTIAGSVVMFWFGQRTNEKSNGGT